MTSSVIQDMDVPNETDFLYALHPFQIIKGKRGEGGGDVVVAGVMDRSGNQTD